MNQIKTFLVKKDIEYINTMIERVEWFWDCVLNKKEDEILAAMPPKKERKPRKKKGEL
jgi:hypothetical protein